MKQFNLKWWMGAMGVAAMAVFAPLGCEEGANTNEVDSYFESHPYVSDPRNSASRVTVTPSSADIDTVGGSAVFQAFGGIEPYTWDVSKPALGRVRGSGKSGVYTATAVGENEVIVYDRDGQAAIAKINGTVSELKITVDPEVVAADSDTATLSVTGGQPPYTWSVAMSGLGEFIPPGANTGSSVVYKRSAAGDNAVTVTDSAGNTARAAIEQPAP